MHLDLNPEEMEPLSVPFHNTWEPSGSLFFKAPEEVPSG